LWEIKTAEYSNDGKYNEFTRKMEFKSIVNDAIIESEIAKSCVKKYVLGITDKDLFERLTFDSELKKRNIEIRLI
jgi:hypothetical protein